MQTPKTIIVNDTAVIMTGRWPTSHYHHSLVLFFFFPPGRTKFINSAWTGVFYFECNDNWNESTYHNKAKREGALTREISGKIPVERGKKAFEETRGGGVVLMYEWVEGTRIYVKRGGCTHRELTSADVSWWRQRRPSASENRPPLGPA